MFHSEVRLGNKMIAIHLTEKYWKTNICKSASIIGFFQFKLPQEQINSTSSYKCCEWFLCNSDLLSLFQSHVWGLRKGF